MDLTIKDLSKKSNKIIVHENLPELPFYLTIIGKSNSGKTNMLQNMFDFFKKYIKRKHIFYFCKSHCDIPGINIYHSINVKDKDGIEINMIDALMKIQKSIKDQGKKSPQILLIFDDFITSSDLNSRRGNISSLFTMARHFNISVVLTSQSYNLIPATIRRMTLYSIIYPIYNCVEKKIMIVENQRNKTEDVFERIYQYATNGQYNFLFIDMKKDRFFKNFKEEITNKFD